jgi:hypothetical protein
LRSTRRRTKQVFFRRHRVPIEERPEESASEEPADDGNDSEKIEVHVHVHRGEDPRKARSKQPARPALTGVLFDWQWYQDLLSSRPRQTASGRWSLVTTCRNCDSPVHPTARCCPRCAAPRPRRILPAVIALIALGAVGALFALGTRILGTSVPEHQPTAPLGEWTQEEPVIVEVPTTPSPFSYTSPPAQSSPPKTTESTPSQ